MADREDEQKPLGDIAVQLTNGIQPSLLKAAIRANKPVIFK